MRLLQPAVFYCGSDMQAGGDWLKKASLGKLFSKYNNMPPILLVKDKSLYVFGVPAKYLSKLRKPRPHFVGLFYVYVKEGDVKHDGRVEQ